MTPSEAVDRFLQGAGRLHQIAEQHQIPAADLLAELRRRFHEAEEADMSNEPQPDHVGPMGTAWNCELPRRTPDQEATLASWLVVSPCSHPMWTAYQLGVIHLRDMPGVKPAFKLYPGAEYEIALYPLDPACNAGPGNPEQWMVLSPPNVVVQFDGCDDEWAAGIGADLAKACVDGWLPLEPQEFVDGVIAWETTVRLSAEHQRNPTHASPLSRN